MATANNVLKRVDASSPNSYTKEQKTEWIFLLDGQIRNDCGASPLVLEIGTDDDTELFAGAPYDSVYDLYVCAMMDFFNREMTAYNNSAALYTSALNEFKSWYIRTHRPPKSGGIIF